MKNILWSLLYAIDNNWGYTTQLQRRFKVGDIVKITSNKTIENKFEVDSVAKIIETARHDYLIEQNGIKIIVYQFEIY
mgnify:FL=1|jgi:hypothetical protein|tara:strand:- start:69 stop:302 length:234 start_codon:yes stop_codon:yes gene_type:complete